MTPTDIYAVVMPFFAPLYFLFIYHEARGVIHRHPDEGENFLPGRRFSNIFLIVAIIYTTAMMIVHIGAGMSAFLARFSIILSLGLIWFVNRRFLSELESMYRQDKE